MRDPEPTPSIGRYQLVEELGRGAMGIVYRAFDPVIGRTVALKTIAAAGLARDAEEFRRRLFREASAAGALAHPNIVTIYDVVAEEDVTAVAMEFVEGETLESMIARCAPLPLDFAIDLVEQVCAGLDYAAQKGIVHRDIKPANILVGSDGRPRIADFGIARLPASTMTVAGAVLGSAGYMSPEQVQGRALDSRSDLFSAATVFYEMLTGANPFGAEDAATAMYRIVHETALPIHEVNPALAPSVTSVLDRALAKSPDDRYRTGAEFVAALRECVALRYGDATEGAFPIAAPPSRGRTRTLAVVAVIGGLAACAALAAFLLARPTARVTDRTTPTRGTPPAAEQAATVPSPLASEPRVPAEQPAARTETSGSKVPDMPVGSRGATARPPVADGLDKVQPSPSTVEKKAPGDARVPASDVEPRTSKEAAPPRAAADRSATRAPAAASDSDTAAATQGSPGKLVAIVKGEAYGGVRIFVDGRMLDTPYPGELQSIAPGTHTIRFTWISGPFAGKDLKQSFEVKAGRQLRIQAVPDNDEVVVQVVR